MLICRNPGLAAVCLFGSTLLLVGCQSQAVLDLRDQVVLAAEPADAISVIEARRQIAGESQPQRVTVVGRIGHDMHTTWQSGQASFILRDESLKVDTSHTHADGRECAFCKQRKKEESTAQALVKFVDAAGNVLPVDARAVLGARGGESVVVEGLAKQDQLGNLELEAKGIYIRPS